MDRETDAFVESVPVQSYDALKISGDKWRAKAFKSYRSVAYPDYDVCEQPLEMEAFDFIVAEQVMEHLLRPHQAVRNVHAMLRPGGWFVVTTPFLLKLHPMPHDSTRWSEEGMRYMLAECGFKQERIKTGAWGNRACVRSNFSQWTGWIPWLHSLKNEFEFPVVVWAFAQK